MPSEAVAKIEARIQLKLNKEYKNKQNSSQQDELI